MLTLPLLLKLSLIKYCLGTLIRQGVHYSEIYYSIEVRVSVSCLTLWVLRPLAQSCFEDILYKPVYNSVLKTGQANLWPILC